MKVALAIITAILLVGCATSGGNPDVINDAISPSKAAFAGMMFAMQAPEQAARMSKSCNTIAILMSKDALLDYLRSRLTADYFAEMTPAQANITQMFIRDVARDVGLNIDFVTPDVTITDRFDLGRAKEIVSATCDGIKVGLE